MPPPLCPSSHFSHPPTHTTLTPNRYIPHIHTHACTQHNTPHTCTHTRHTPCTRHITCTQHTHHSHPTCVHTHRFSRKGSLFTKHALPEEASQLLATQPGVLFLAFSELKFSQCCMTQLTRQPSWTPQWPLSCERERPSCAVRGSLLSPICETVLQGRSASHTGWALGGQGHSKNPSPTPAPPHPREPGVEWAWRLGKWLQV